MLNVYELIQTGLHYNKFVVDELLFVEYSCPIEEESLGIWTPSDYMLHVLSGKKGWRSMDQSWTAEAGQTFYVKKGTYFIDQYFEEEFCMLLFFISDDFIRDTVKQIVTEAKLPSAVTGEQPPVMEVENDLILTTYFQSMLTYFTKRIKPSDSLLRLKLKELLLNILQSARNPELAGYFRSLQHDLRPSISQIMSKNFCYNLSLAAFAELSGRSLSSFKRDFKKHYHMPPGAWLRQQRLQYARTLLGDTKLTISEICLACGFENLAHFSRVFKEDYNISPSDYRKHNSD